MHLIDDILRAISDELALAFAWAVSAYHWFVGDMSPISALGAIAAFVLSVAKIWEVYKRRRDMRFLKEAFALAEEDGDNAARDATARMMRDNINSRRGGL